MLFVPARLLAVSIDMKFNNILVICTGNICRSPMGEALLKQAFPERKVCSAGIQGLTGEPADAMAIEVMNEIGVSMDSHIAQKITPELLKQADLILTMTKSQIKRLEQQHPFTRGKTFLIGHWINKEVPDPYKQSRDAFIYARDIVVEGINAWKVRL